MLRIGPAFFFYSVFPFSATPPPSEAKAAAAAAAGSRDRHPGSIAIEFEGGVQGVLYCATNIVGRFRFNRVAQEEEEEVGGGGWRWRSWPGATVLRSPSSPPPPPTSVT